MKIQDEIKEYDALSAIYDNVYAPTWPLGPNLEGLISFLKTFSGGKNILEIGVGTGNVIGLLHNAGYKNLTGVDFSSKMLELAKKKAPNLTAIEQDLRETDYSGFDWIISVGSTLNRISNEDKKELFLKMYNEMDAGALFFISLRNYEYNHNFKKEKNDSGEIHMPTKRSTQTQDKDNVARFIVKYEQEWISHDHFHGTANYLDLKTNQAFDYVYQTYVITENDLLELVTMAGFKHIHTEKPDGTKGYYANIWVFEK